MRVGEMADRLRFCHRMAVVTGVAELGNVGIHGPRKGRNSDVIACRCLSRQFPGSVFPSPIFLQPSHDAEFDVKWLVQLSRCLEIARHNTKHEALPGISWPGTSQPDQILKFPA